MVAKFKEAIAQHGLVQVLTLLLSIFTAITISLTAFIGARAINQIDRNREGVRFNDKNIAILEKLHEFHGTRISNNTNRICELEYRNGDVL